MIEEVHINQSFRKFLNKHDIIITKIFDTVKSFKNDIPDSYLYSPQFPPKRSNYKYNSCLQEFRKIYKFACKFIYLRTDKLFLGCIIGITSCQSLVDIIVQNVERIAGFSLWGN